jgi:hypothetical protein
VAPQPEARRKIIDVEGIEPVCAEELNGAHIETTEDLLEAGKTRGGRAGPT